jgi:hypothetical protein
MPINDPLQQTGPPTQEEPQIDLTSAQTITCEKCGGVVFKHGLLVKRVSELTSPVGKELIVPIQTIVCNACGHINKKFREGSYVEDTYFENAESIKPE